MSMAVMSPLLAPPSAVKNLSPLRLKGRCEAVIMMAPSEGHKRRASSVTVLMNMAGVEARPYVTTSTPAQPRPLATAACNHRKGRDPVRLGAGGE